MTEVFDILRQTQYDNDNLFNKEHAMVARQEWIGRGAMNAKGYIPLIGI